VHRPEKCGANVAVSVKVDIDNPQNGQVNSRLLWQQRRHIGHLHGCSKRIGNKVGRGTTHPCLRDHSWAKGLFSSKKLDWCTVEVHRDVWGQCPIPS
jgi:hypothetical protein